MFKISFLLGAFAPFGLLSIEEVKAVFCILERYSSAL